MGRSTRSRTFDLKPLLVIDGVPILIPDVIVGLFLSLGRDG